MNDLGQIGIEGTRQGRGHSGIEGSLLAPPSFREDSDDDGDEWLERCQSQTQRASGGYVGPPETWCSQRRFRTSRHLPDDPAPFPWPRSRGDPELEKTPRQAPRLGAAERDRKVSRKREAQVRKQRLWGTAERQG